MCECARGREGRRERGKEVVGGGVCEMNNLPVTPRRINASPGRCPGFVGVETRWREPRGPGLGPMGWGPCPWVGTHGLGRETKIENRLYLFP